MKDLSLISILDANKRDAFLNPLKVLGIEDFPLNGSISLTFSSSSEIELHDEILVNGAPLRLGRTYNISGEDIEDYYFLIYLQELADFELDFVFHFNGAESLEDVRGKLFTKKNLECVNDIFSQNVCALTDTTSSYQMIRTNPKLSGNIKLVVSKDQTLYLDTFKVSDNLNKFAYRHKVVSGESNYSTDVRNVFKSLDSVDLYKVPDVDLKAHNIYTDFDLQYDTTYEYGVETNTDELYDENFRFLAPLWVNKNLPDFFAIFRVDGVCNIESYKQQIDDTEILKKFLREGKVVKVFDLRISSPLGKYLHNHFDKISEYPGSVLLHLKEQETQNRFNNGINSWFGISLDSGLIVKKDETTFFANEKIETHSQEKLNQFIVDGFERNRLLCPNIINLEFLFDDEDVENYSMNRYFGLYLKENDFLEYDFVENVIDSTTENYDVKKFDSSYHEVDDTVVSGPDSILERDEYKDRLFFGVSTNAVNRLQDRSDLKNFLRENVTNQAYKNYKNCFGRLIEAPKEHFVTLKFKKEIQYGEHFRLIVPNFSIEGLDAPVIFEMIASNDNRLATAQDCISPYLNITNSINDLNNYIYYREIKNKPFGDEYVNATDNMRQSYYFRARRGETYSQFPIVDIVRYQNKYGAVNKLKHGDVDGKRFPYIFRLNFYTQSEFDNEENADLSAQVKRLKTCFEVLNEYFGFKINVLSSNKDSFSIVTDYEDVYFQHITNEILDNDYVEIASKKTDYHHENPDGFDVKYFQTNIGDLYYDSVREVDDLGPDETVLYFGRDDLGVKLFALDNKSKLYSSDSYLFAPINFELLGWRKSSVVRLAKFAKYNYEIEVDDISKFRVNTLVKSTMGHYVRLKDFEINSFTLHFPDHLEKVDIGSEYAAYLEDDKAKYQELKQKIEEKFVSEKYQSELEELDKYEKEIIDIESFKDDLWRYRISSYDTYTRLVKYPVRTNLVQSPFNLGLYIISSNEPLSLQGDVMSLYSSTPFNIALMGILPIKDFDTVVGYSYSTKVNNTIDLTIPKNTKVYIDEKNKEYSLKSGVYYTVEQGKFKNMSLIQGSSFIILNGVLYYNSGNSGNSILSKKLNGGYLETNNSNTLVKISQLKPKVVCDYTFDSPLIDFEKYFDENDISKDLKYSLLSPTVLNWRGVGMYYDHDSVLKIENILSDAYKNINLGYFTVSNQDFFKDSEMYIYNSLRSVLKTEDGKEQDFLTFLSTTKLTDSINLFLTDGQKPIYTVGYYNKYVDNLSFIVYGIKFEISFNTNQHIKNLMLQEYNRYEIYIINDYTGDKDEIFINTIENVILIVMHNFNFHKFDEKRNIFYSKDGKLKTQSMYNWIVTDKHIDINKTEVSGDDVYIPIIKGSSLNEDVGGEKFVQMNYFNQEKYMYEQTNENSLMIFDYNHLNRNYLKMDYLDTFLKSEELDNKFYMYNHNFDFLPCSLYDNKNWIINPYYENEIDYLSESSKTPKEMYDAMIKDFATSLSSENLRIYLKTQTVEDASMSIIETSALNAPLKIEYTLPNHTKYLTDFYNPNFVDVVDFAFNEDETLMKEIGLNCLLGNTLVSQVNKLKNYYGFKIFELNKHGNLKDVNMFVIPERSVMSSNWDEGYYRLYKNKSFQKVDGFVPGVEDKSFFGSKGIKLKNVSVEIKEWTGSEISVTSQKISAYATNTENHVVGKSLNVRINLTQTFCDNFKESDKSGSVFRSNWFDFGVNTDIAKNNFLKQSLINYFKLNNKNDVQIFAKKKENGREILLSEPTNISEFSEVKNFDSVYFKENDELFLDITLPDSSKTYYISYTFKSNF